MPPCKYGISAGVLLPACTLCCSVSSHPTSTLMERAGIIRWASMRDEVRAAKMHDRGGRSRCLWESLQTIEGLGATEETMTSFRSNDLGLGPINRQCAWCLGSHTGRTGSGHVSGGGDPESGYRSLPSRVYPHRRLWKRPRGLNKGGVTHWNISVHDVSSIVKLRARPTPSSQTVLRSPAETSFVRCHNGRGHRVI